MLTVYWVVKMLCNKKRSDFIIEYYVMSSFFFYCTTTYNLLGDNDVYLSIKKKNEKSKLRGFFVICIYVFIYFFIFMSKIYKKK